jgi:hypothetical protein
LLLLLLLLFVAVVVAVGPAPGLILLLLLLFRLFYCVYIYIYIRPWVTRRQQDHARRRKDGQATAQNAKADSTLRSSQAVPHPSTNRALCRLTSEVERDPVHSTRYGRQRADLPPRPPRDFQRGPHRVLPSCSHLAPLRLPSGSVQLS